MRYRKLGPTGDFVFGHGSRDFFINVPDAPAQAVLTRLNLWVGDWFLDRTAGTPYRTKVLGKYTGNVRDPILQGRILGTQGVTALIAYASQFTRQPRVFNVQAQVQTVYSTTPIVVPGQSNIGA